MSANSATYTFQPKPDSLQIVTVGSYVIPATNFARVNASAMDGGTVTLNGTTVAKGAMWDAAGIDGNLYRNPDNTSGAAGRIATGQTFVGRAMPSQSAAGPVYDTSVAAPTDLTAVFKNMTARFNAIHDFNVPAGTTVAVTGDAVAVVELYSG